MRIITTVSNSEEYGEVEFAVINIDPTLAKTYLSYMDMVKKKEEEDPRFRSISLWDHAPVWTNEDNEIFSSMSPEDYEKLNTENYIQADEGLLSDGERTELDECVICSDRVYYKACPKYMTLIMESCSVSKEKIVEISKMEA
jgi:hypothetical protein